MAFIVFKCKGEKYFKSGSTEGIICPVDNGFCIYSGYCSLWKKVRHTERAETCRKRELIDKNTTKDL